MSRRSTVLLVVIVLVLSAVGLGFWMIHRAGGREGIVDFFEIFPSEDRLVLEPANFEGLPGWREDAVEEAVPALLRSCKRIGALPDEAGISDEAFAGRAGDWKPLCARAARLPAGDRTAARRFFEAGFQPWAVLNNRNPLGLFTGYYEPLLHGSRKRHGRYTVPLYARPPELVMVDLGKFREEFKGKRIAGEVKDGALVPFADRKAIDEGALAGRKLEIVWVDDPVGAFFLHVQGSGRVRLEDGTEVRVGYAAQNGRPYSSVAREMIDRGVLDRDRASLQTIRAWLQAHPGQMDEILQTDASFIFFQEVKGEGPMGAEGVPLTAGRSMAVDLKYMPMGVPLWLSAGVPALREGQPDQRIHRLLIAQDTGGAIRGPVRGDVFWGFGDEAEVVAGRMKHRGRYWVMLPKGVGPEAGG
ncbi:MAG: murein transglycosylase A [Thermoanaerobaculia bacterium]